MQASARSIWFCVVVGLIGLALAPINLRFAILWSCSWFGSAIFFVGARRRFPAFVQLPPLASLKDLGIPDEALGGALSNPWYVLLLTGTTWVCVMGVPLLMPETSLVGFGVGIAVTLLGAAAWLGMRQSGPVKLGKALLGPLGPEQRRVVGIVRNEAAPLRRDTFWFRLGGYRQEDRAELELSVDGETITIDTHRASWAAPPRSLRSPPALRERAHGGWLMGSAMIRSGEACEREQISRGQRVVARGVWDAAARRIGGEVILFGLGGDRDPVAALRRELVHRRWPIAALIGLSVLAVVVSIVG